MRVLWNRKQTPAARGTLAPRRMCSMKTAGGKTKKHTAERQENGVRAGRGAGSPRSAGSVRPRPGGSRADRRGGGRLRGGGNKCWKNQLGCFAVGSGGFLPLFFFLLISILFHSPPPLFLCLRIKQARTFSAAGRRPARCAAGSARRDPPGCGRDAPALACPLPPDGTVLPGRVEVRCPGIYDTNGLSPSSSV